MGAEEAVVPESEVKQLRAQIRELQRLLGKKTLECRAATCARPAKALH
jgi:hypothetical protein